MTTLRTSTITTALTADASTGLPLETFQCAGCLIDINLVYGSGGTSGKVWVQTSIDGGTTYTDIACMAFTTATKRRLHNLRASTPVTTPYTMTDGTLTDDTCKDGIIGNIYRVKVTTIGTYAGSTTLTVTAIAQP